MGKRENRKERQKCGEVSAFGKMVKNDGLTVVHTAQADAVQNKHEMESV